MTHEERAQEFWANPIHTGTPVEKLTREFQAVDLDARHKAIMECIDEVVVMCDSEICCEEPLTKLLLKTMSREDYYKTLPHTLPSGVIGSEKL